MKYFHSYVNYWGYEMLIKPNECLGRFAGCLSDCQVKNCYYRQA